MRIIKFILKGIGVKSLLSFTLLLSFFVLFVGASNFSVKAPETIYKWCVQPYIVKMSTNNIQTKSIDSKLFLSWYFSIVEDKTTFSEAISQNIYANYIEWDIFDTLTIQPGIANSGGIYQNTEYLYLNWFQNFNNTSVSGSNLSIATLYLKANNFNTGYISFYYVTWRNGDDSNISSGMNAGTLGSYVLYTDALNSVNNLIQPISNSNACESKPYISQAKYRQTWYISTSTGVQAVWTSVIAWPLYSGNSDRNLWTKSSVFLELTWVSDSYLYSGWLAIDNLSRWIKINDWLVSALSHSHISRLDTNTWWNNQYYKLLISGNVSTWFVWFENILWNMGSTYSTWSNKYTNTFNIDVFWIDTVPPTKNGYFTGYISASGGITTTYTLSGMNYSGSISSPNNWFHANWTDKDDEYKVIWFSGKNTLTQDCENLGYACNETWYMAYLNATWYVRSGNNIFKLKHNIVFTNSFSGIVIVIDRAGNTGEWNIAINMDDNVIVNYGLIAYPQLWVERNSSINLSGMLMKLAVYSGWFNKERLLWSGNIELVYTWWIKTSSTWYALFTWNFSSWQYWALAEWVNTLSYLISWVNLNPIGGNVDFRTAYPWWFKFGDMYATTDTFNSKHATYLSTWSNRDGIVNTSDLARLVTIWGDYSTMNTNSVIWVYSGEYFVDKPTNWTWTKIDSNLLQQAVYTNEYMQYHPYDINANGQVNNIDYSVMLENIGDNWATYGWKLNWLTSATMPF